MNSLKQRFKEIWCWIRNGGHELYEGRLHHDDGSIHFRRKCLFCTYTTTGWVIEKRTLKSCVVDPGKVSPFKRRRA